MVLTKEHEATILECIDARIDQIHKSTMADWRKMDEYYAVINLCNELDLDVKAREIENDIKV